MKAEAQPVAASEPEARGLVSLLGELFKIRLTALVLVTMAVGFYLASPTPLDVPLFLHALAGTGLLAAGAATLNQFIEREHDARMRRTEDRPLPSGRMQPAHALVIGGLVSAAGMVWLAQRVNLTTAMLGVATLASYLFVYTPLKRLTTANTMIGAIPGALPPLMGWTAASGEISVQGWSLFAILFLWQLPHFYAIAWMYREDYAKAGYVMLPVVDPEGQRTGRHAVSHTLGLLAVSLAPVATRVCGPGYLAAALLLGLGMLACAIGFARQLTTASARRLFFASILYLPLLLAAMVFDKVKH
jgi:protoheme IX farnesyltransferase